MWVAKLHTDQTVGSSVMKARVVTVSGVTWTSFTSSYTVVVWGLGWGGIAIDWVTQRWRFWHKHLRLMYSQATVRSYTKDRAVLRWDHTLKGGRFEVVSVNQSNTAEIFMGEPSQATLDTGFLRPLWWKGHRSRVRSRCESPKVPSGRR